MTATSLELPRLDIGLADLAHGYDLLLCDVWGVLHNGLEHHPAAVDALQRFRASGGTVVLITNAPVPSAQVARRLESLAVPNDAYDDIATSGDVTVSLLVSAGCPPVLHIGPEDEHGLYREAGRLGPREPRLVGTDAAALAVCVGLDDTRPTLELYDSTLQALRARDLELICANPDIVVEVGDELVYCAGAVAARYTAQGGRVVGAGKPSPAIYERAIRLAAAVRDGTQKSRILAIGDAVKTDLQGADGQGIDSLFITSGIHRDALHAGRRDTSIESVRLARFLADHGARPVAAMPTLCWSATVAVPGRGPRKG